MRALHAAGWALGGAVVAVALVFAIQGFGPRESDGDHAAEETASVAETAFGSVKIDADTQKRAGIALAPLRAGSTGTVHTGYARAIDLSGLAAINADYRAARAAAAVSAREVERQRALFKADTSTSARAVEQAEAQAAADREKVTLACRRVALEVGAGLERIGCPALDGLLRDAAAGRAALVRLDFPEQALRAGMVVAISGQGTDGSVHVLGAAATADPQLQTSGALAVLRGPLAARVGVGQVLEAHVAGGGAVRTGVLVPRAAILRADGSLWVYRAVSADMFERVELHDARPAADGWLVPSGLTPGDRVVVSAAGTLFGLERSVPAEEDE